MKLLVIFLAILVTVSAACAQAPAKPQTPSPAPKPPAETPQPPPPPPPPAKPEKTRAEAIPANATKMTRSTDTLPPKLHSTEYQQPVPLGSGVNTAGGEDSAFVTPDGNTLYFFFTPDVSTPAEKQLLDGVTGIWVSRKEGGQWQPAQRVWLQDKNDVALDGCAFVQRNILWFCSVRKDNLSGVDMWIAEYKDGKWTNWKNAGKKLNVDYDLGEMHLSADGNELYFHSPRAGGKGQYDIWVSKKVGGDWQEPQNIEAVNTPDNEGWPFISQNGNELWFHRTYMGAPAIFRSKKVDGKWGKPEHIVSQFAAEPSLDNAGNLYFVHHYFKNGKMIEADIYVAYRKYGAEKSKANQQAGKRLYNSSWADKPGIGDYR